MASITRSEVQNVYGNKEPSIGTSQRDALVSIAERFTEDVVGGKVSTLAELEGNENDFAKYVAAHLWTLAEGGETQSSSQTGGSVNYGHLQGNIEQTLGETRYGRFAQALIRSSDSIGIIRADR